ncbi:MAG: ferritin-like domain-containing protein [Candidatus Heimdallarchaeaceae archaeon]|jgi:rubrerythrin
MLEEEKIGFYKKQIKLEKRIGETAENSVKSVKNELIKELINSIALDSKKHASMINSLIAMSSSTQPFIDEEKYDELVKNIEEHIKLELEAIKTYKVLIDRVENEEEKILLQSIHQDELRHHTLLKKILRSIIEKEAITQADIWDSIKEDFLPQF